MFVRPYRPQVSTVYNSAIATSNTDIIVNSVIVLFVMEMDEWIFSTLEAINEKWTKHAAESGDKSADDTDAEKRSTLDEMKGEIELQKAQIAGQQEELDLQKEKMARQSDEITLLREVVQKIQDSLAVAATFSDSIPQCAANACVNAHETESEDTDNTDAEEGGTINEMKKDLIAVHEEEITAIQGEEITVAVPCDAEHEIEESQVAAAISKSDSETVSECADDTKTELRGNSYD
eukprot:scaffold6859_cov100-Skeletonema_marinoi.AAC.6